MESDTVETGKVEPDNEVFVARSSGTKVTKVTKGTRGGVEGSPQVPGFPSLVFIVPYRDRQQQLAFFDKQMRKTVLEDMDPSSYSIYYVEQCDTRDFNRGAMKNIGFLAMKAKYPDDYKNITFVFNDIDTMPYTANFLNYHTKPGVIKHFYGYTFTLGGIVSITGADFEKIIGYPNFWAWGYEDNLLQIRALSAKLTIDRSQFYPIMDKNILQLKDGLERVVNRKEFNRYAGNTIDGILTIRDLVYEVDEAVSKIKVTGFLTDTANMPHTNVMHDIRNGSRPFPAGEPRFPPRPPPFSVLRFV
jgi:hypothetical protein